MWVVAARDSRVLAENPPQKAKDCHPDFEREFPWTGGARIRRMLRPLVQGSARSRWARTTATGARSTRTAVRGSPTAPPNDGDRIEIGPTLLFDPLNIRYATDSTNMQLWNTHNPFRALVLCADDYTMIWDYKNSSFLSTSNPLVREQRSGADFFYFDRGDKTGVAAKAFAGEVAELIRTHGGANMRLAVDNILRHGLRALEAAGLKIMEGEEITETGHENLIPYPFDARLMGGAEERGPGP